MRRAFALGILLGSGSVPALAADVVPPTVQMPGTQPGQVSSLETANRCDNCHAATTRAPSRASCGTAA